MSTHAEAALVGSAVEHVVAEEDHAGARAERRHAGRKPLGDRFEQAGGVEQQRHRRGLSAPGSTRASTPSSWSAVRTSRLQRRGRAGKPACVANAPCRASTPTFTWRPLTHCRTSVEASICAPAPSASAGCDRCRDALATSLDRFHGVEPGARRRRGRPGTSAAPDARAVPRLRRRPVADQKPVQRMDRARTSFAISPTLRTWTTARQGGEGPRNPGGRIDPRTDPAEWLEASNGQSPPETVASFEAAMAAERTAFDRRLRDAGDDVPSRRPYGLSTGPCSARTCFGTCGCTSATSSSLSVCLTTPRSARTAWPRCTRLTVASTVPTFLGSTVSASIELTGGAPGSLRVGRFAGRTRVDFARTNGEAELRAELGPLVDSLAGRGPDVADVLDGPSDVGGVAHAVARLPAADRLTTSRGRPA